LYIAYELNLNYQLIKPMNLPAGYDPQKNLNAVIHNTTKFIQLNWKPLLAVYCIICTLFLVPAVVFDYLYPTHYAPPGHRLNNYSAEQLQHTGIRFLLSTLGDAALAATVLWFIKLYVQNGVVPSAKQVWDSFKLLYLRYYFALALIYMVVILGFVLLIVPGALLAPIAALTVVIMVFDNLGLTEARRRGQTLATQNWDLTLGVFYFFVLAIIVLLIAKFGIGAVMAKTAAPYDGRMMMIRLLFIYISHMILMLQFIGMSFCYLSIKAPLTIPVIDELDASAAH
jgi:hypothetical protein